MNTKILIIGQAPPFVAQKLPYDTTMLYDWFQEIGISKEASQELFLFDAVYDQFPGFDKNGGHNKPSNLQMQDYWERSLKSKIESVKSVLVLGNVAKDFLLSKSVNKKCIYLIHPSKRNYSIYKKNKEEILNKLKTIL